MNHYTLAEMTPGLTEEFTVTVTPEMMDAFRAITGDVSPIHIDADYARGRGFPGRVVYGMLGASFFSTLAGVYLPGEHCLLHGVECKFAKPIFIGDTLTVKGTVVGVSEIGSEAEIKAVITNHVGAQRAPTVGKANPLVRSKAPPGLLLLRSPAMQASAPTTIEEKIMSYTYLITGATSDVGRALIERLLQNAPADTLVLAQGCGDLEKLADLCARFPGQVRPFDVDLSDRAKVDTFVQVLAASAPAPTHFIHLPALPVVNAKFKAFDQTRFDRDLEIQVHSAVRICRAVLPAMAKARFGRVLFIQTSYTIGCPPKNTAAYVMAKSAIGGLVKSLAVEYARFGVTVNCVAPSMMETNFLKDTPDLIVQAAAEENPMGRNATPADVVPAMAFLLSDEAGFITGVTLPVTGGSTIV